MSKIRFNSVNITRFVNLLRIGLGATINWKLSTVGFQQQQRPIDLMEFSSPISNEYIEFL